MSYEIQEIDANQTYPLRHKVLWPDQPFDFVKIATDSEALHFGAFADGEIIGVASLYPTKNGMQLRKLATDAAYRGQGIGTALVKQVIAAAVETGAERLFLNGRAVAHDFYTTLGFTPYGSPYLVKDEPCQMMEMHLKP